MPEPLALFDSPTDHPPVTTTCSCLRTRGGSDEGFTNRGAPGAPWWVHAACGHPTVGYVTAMGGRRG